MMTNPLTIDGNQIEFVETAEHVGIVRATSGNLPAILSRLSSHKKALGAVLHTGVARGHRGNPAASLRVGKDSLDLRHLSSYRLKKPLLSLMLLI